VVVLCVLAGFISLRGSSVDFGRSCGRARWCILVFWKLPCIGQCIGGTILRATIGIRIFDVFGYPGVLGKCGWGLSCVWQVRGKIFVKSIIHRLRCSYIRTWACRSHSQITCSIVDHVRTDRFLSLYHSYGRKSLLIPYGEFFVGVLRLSYYGSAPSTCSTSV
jgi:hypothetical protein